MKKKIQYTPKGKIFYIIQDYHAIGFKNGSILEYERICRRYIPKNIFGERVITALYSYTLDQIRLLQRMGIVSP